MNAERIETLRKENLVWITYIIFAYFGIKANNLEIDDILNNNQKNKKEYKTINIIIILVSLIIYIYFINLTYKRYEKTHKSIDGIQALASTLILISGLLLLYAEIHGDDIVPNEI